MNPAGRGRSLATRWRKAGHVRLWLLLLLTFWPGIALADDAGSNAVNAAAQERVAELLQEALGPFHSEPEPGDGPAKAAMQRLLSLEARFREASRLMPARLDLRLGIASALILQAIQTNSPFASSVSNALSIYQQIRALDTNGFEAAILYAAYSRAIGDENASGEAIRRLRMIHPQRTQEFLERFQRVEDILRMIPGHEPKYGLPTDHCHAIVVLGAALETNGAAKPKLVRRLQQGLNVARVYPEASLIVTGGNQKCGITEAYVMSLWLKNQGVSSERLYLEDKARDTVGNAFYSSAILEKLGVTHVTVVTSANHIQRGLADLQEACLQRGLKLSYATLAAGDDSLLDDLRERVAIYRDAMRASGLWAFPGIQR